LTFTLVDIVETNFKKKTKTKKIVRKLFKKKKWITILENTKCKIFLTTPPSPTKINKQKTNNKKPTHIKKTQN